MSLDTIYLKETKRKHGGVQNLYSFPNGYGASVICHEGSYGGNEGLWEIAPDYGKDRVFIGQSTLEWYDDVKGRLSDAEVNVILKEVSELKQEDAVCMHCGDHHDDCTGYKCWIR